MRKTVRIEAGDPREEILKEMAAEALKPENLMVVAKGPENRKDSSFDCIEKYGMCFYTVGHVSGNNSTNVFMEHVSPDETTTALKNTAASARIGSLEDVIDEILYGVGGFKPCEAFYRLCDFKPGDSPTYVLITADRTNGAGLMLCDGVFIRLRQILNKNFWIVPSSVHELIIIPVSDDFFISKNKVVSMVAAVNREEVLPEERLINNAFFFDGAIH